MADPIHVPTVKPDRDHLEALVRRLERTTLTDGPAPRIVPLGFGAIDGHLNGGGLALGRVHEVTGEVRSEVRDAAPFGFATALLTQLPEQGDVLWCPARANVTGGALAAHGLAELGLDPARVIIAACDDPMERMRAVEEGLNTPGLAAVVGEFDPARRGDVTTSRRLQLAAEKSGVTGLILRPRLALPDGREDRVSLAVETRWAVSAAPVPARHDTRPAWTLRLERAVRGKPGEWRVLWDARTHAFQPLALPDASATDQPALITANVAERAA